MEKLNFIDPLLHGIKPEKKDYKDYRPSVKHLVFAGLGSLLAGAVLKKAGQNKTAAVVGSLAVPFLAAACYKKITETSKEKREKTDSSGIEYNY